MNKKLFKNVESTLIILNDKNISVFYNFISFQESLQIFQPF